MGMARPPKWRCPACGASNDESLERCRLCHSPRSAERRPSSPPGYLAQPPPEELQEDGQPSEPAGFEPPAAPPLRPGDRIVTYAEDRIGAWQEPTPPEASAGEPTASATNPVESYEIGGPSAPEEPGPPAEVEPHSSGEPYSTGEPYETGEPYSTGEPYETGEPYSTDDLYETGELYGAEAFTLDAAVPHDEEPAEDAAPTTDWRGGLGAFQAHEVQPPEPPAPSSPDRRVLAIAGVLAAVVVLLIGALVMSGGSSPQSALSPAETVGELLPVTTARPGPDIPTENVAAVAMLPTKGDFGPLWSQIEVRAGKDAFELGPNPSSAQCVLPPPSVPEAGARVDLANYYEGASVAAQVKVFQDGASAVNDVATAPVTSDATACLQQSTQAELGKRGIADLVTIEVGLDTLESPGLGEESYAYRFTISIAAGRLHAVQDIDIVSFRTGRTVGQLTVSTGYNSDNAPLLATALDVFIPRFIAQ
jgi:hypothetical protein